ncbi:LamG domain-containing protein [Candidatus Thiosymbion oneisti]|uniref:LamG domain-containing protein n=2 Tax=Candidatus Thiosymbion oneisti TaxID=589554 RepID=UPI0013FD279F
MDYLRTGTLELPPFAVDTDGGRIVSAWVWLESAQSQAQLIVGQDDQAIELGVDTDNKVQLKIHCDDNSTHDVKDPDALSLKTWVHYAGTVEYETGTSKQTRLYLCRNGAKVTPTAATGETIVDQEKVIADHYPTGLTMDAFRFGGTNTKHAVTIPGTVPAAVLTLAFWVKTQAGGEVDLV